MRVILFGLLVIGLATSALGWLIYSPSMTRGPAGGPGDAACCRDLDAVRRFSLPDADRKSERETPAVAVDDQGRVILAWTSLTGEGERTIWLARSPDGGRSFADPKPFRKVKIHQNKARMKNKEIIRPTTVVPRLVSRGDQILLGWTEGVEPAPRASYFVASTKDGGGTFSEPVRVHGDKVTRPGFTSLAVGPDGSLACCWIDNRNGSQQPFCSLAPPDGKVFDAEELVYAGPTGNGICPCCDTEVLFGRDAAYVAFRNQDDNYRDIWISRRREGKGWEPSVAVCKDRWNVNGCPHDGPSLAVSGDHLHVAWMDASSGVPRVHVAQGDLQTLKFQTKDLHADGPGAQGHPRLAASADTLCAVWEENLSSDAPAHDEPGHHHHAEPSAGGKTILFSYSTDQGNTFTKARPLTSGPDGFQGRPALTVKNGQVYVTWNEITQEGKKVAFVSFSPETCCGK